MPGSPRAATKRSRSSAGTVFRGPGSTSSGVPAGDLAAATSAVPGRRGGGGDPCPGPGSSPNRFRSEPRQDRPRPLPFAARPTARRRHAPFRIPKRHRPGRSPGSSRCGPDTRCGRRACARGGPGGVRSPAVPPPARRSPGVALIGDLHVEDSDCDLGVSDRVRWAGRGDEHVESPIVMDRQHGVGLGRV